MSGRRRPPPKAVPSRAAKPRAGKAGSRGGARAGAGRKRAQLPAESVARIGPPPLESPLQLARWFSRLLAELTWLRCLGDVPPELLRDVRGIASSAARMVPEDLRAEVDRQLAALEAATKPDHQGPPLEDIRGEQPSLRGVPR